MVSHAPGQRGVALRLDITTQPCMAVSAKATLIMAGVAGVAVAAGFLGVHCPPAIRVVRRVLGEVYAHMAGITTLLFMAFGAVVNFGGGEATMCLHPTGVVVCGLYGDRVDMTLGAFLLGFVVIVAAVAFLMFGQTHIQAVGFHLMATLALCLPDDV